MIQLKINKLLLDRLREEGFFPDTLITVYTVMKCLATGKSNFLDVLDDNNTSKRMLLIYLDLVRKGILEEKKEGKVLFGFTEKGQALMEELRLLEEGKIKEDDVSTWIEKWVNLFPQGLKTGGKLVRSDVRSCEIRMRKFMKDYKYNLSTIMKATQAYLREQEQRGWDKTRCAIYFIEKRGEGSDLAAYCFDISEKGEEQHYEVTDQMSTGLV